VERGGCRGEAEQTKEQEEGKLDMRINNGQTAESPKAMLYQTFR